MGWDVIALSLRVGIERREEEEERREERRRVDMN